MGVVESGEVAGIQDQRVCYCRVFERECTGQVVVESQWWQEVQGVAGHDTTQTLTLTRTKFDTWFCTDLKKTHLLEYTDINE